MKIDKLYCPCDEQTHEIEHYTHMECPDPPGPFPLLMAILDVNANDKAHTGNKLTATRLTGCPRASAIQDNVMCRYDIRHSFSTIWGTAMNELMDRHTPEGLVAQMTLPPAFLFKRQFPPNGVLVGGTPDLLPADFSGVYDYKCHSGKAQYMKFTKPAAIELSAQVSLYAHLLKQAKPEALPVKFVAWHGAMKAAADKFPPWFPQELQFLTEDEIAALRPYGGRYTVAEHIGMFRRFHGKVDAINLKYREAEEGDQLNEQRQQEIEEAIREIPLVGRDVWRGAKCNLYCDVKWDCDRIEGIVSI